MVELTRRGTGGESLGCCRTRVASARLNAPLVSKAPEHGTRNDDAAFLSFGIDTCVRSVIHLLQRQNKVYEETI